MAEHDGVEINTGAQMVLSEDGLRCAAWIVADVDFGSTIREVRKARGLSQEELENTIGLTHAHLTKVENVGKKYSKPGLRLTQTACWILESLGLAVLVVDRQTAAKVVEMVKE